MTYSPPCPHIKMKEKQFTCNGQYALCPARLGGRVPASVTQPWLHPAPPPPGPQTYLSLGITETQNPQCKMVMIVTDRSVVTVGGQCVTRLSCLTLAVVLIPSLPASRAETHLPHTLMSYDLGKFLEATSPCPQQAAEESVRGRCAGTK